MMKIPPFWRRFQLQARPTHYHAMRRLEILVRKKKISVSQALKIKRELEKVA